MSKLEIKDYITSLTPAEVSKLRQWLNGNIDLHGRRIVNAGTSTSAKDYVTKSEFEALAARVAALEV